MNFRGLTAKITPAALMVCVLLFSRTYNAQETALFDDPKFDAIVSYNFKEAAVTDVLRLIAEQNDLNIVLSPSVTGSVSFRMSNVTLREALNVILEAASCRIEKTDNIIRVYSRSEFDEKQRKGLLVTEIFQVNYVNADQLMDILRDYMSKDGSVKQFTRKNQSARPTRSNRSGNQETNTKEMLIFTDYPESLEKIRGMFEQLDSETRQVMIESRIVETTLSDSDIMGTDWQINASLTGSPVEIDTKYGGKIGYGSLSMSAFKAVYSRLLEDKNANILSNSKLSVMDNEQAHIHVGEVIPVGVNTVGSGPGGGTAFGTTGIQQWEIGVTLDVTPTVLEKEIIRMYISPEISTVQGYSSLSGGSAPITSSRGVQTQILIKSGETIVIGGLVQDQESRINRKIPILGDLPVVGSAFRKKETTQTKINLLIFITGTILDLKSEYQPEMLVSPSVKAEMEAGTAIIPAETATPAISLPAVETSPEIPAETTPSPQPAIAPETAAPAAEPESQKPEETPKPSLEKYLEYK